MSFIEKENFNDARDVVKEKMLFGGTNHSYQTINLETFTTIVNQAYGFLTFLKSVL